MDLLDLTLPSAEENLALDEALLIEAEQSTDSVAILRLWESTERIVVVGRGSSIGVEVDREACAAANVRILRRVTGGSAIVAGPGCLMYAVVLNTELDPGLKSPRLAHRYVLSRTRQAVESLGIRCELAGISDVAFEGRKFGGNSLRLSRHHVLYHGTLLYDFELSMIERLLRLPPRRPEYRGDRPHEEFLTQIALSAGELRLALRSVWRADKPADRWPERLTRELAHGKYGSEEWNSGKS